MKTKYSSVIFYHVIVLILIPLLLTGCKSNKPSRIPTSGCEFIPTPIFNTPLTYDKFHALINNDDQFSWFVVAYFYSSSGITKLLHISGGRVDQTYYFNALDTFKGNFSETNTNTTPVSDLNSNKTFSQSEIQVILDYLNNNQEYFFNNLEYEELSVPFETLHQLGVCRSDFTLVVGFFEPTSFENVWSISKCVDEYPGPDSPLFELFELLEDDFISQFE